MMKDAKKALISVIAKQEFSDGEKTEPVELTTEGYYSYTDNEIKIRYKESMLTGLEGTRTTFTVEGDEVSLTREGALNSCMIFRQGVRNTFLYDTPYGATTMGLDTSYIKMNLDENGGNLQILYTIDFDHNVAGHNKFNITVKTGG